MTSHRSASLTSKLIRKLFCLDVYSGDLMEFKFFPVNPTVNHRKLFPEDFNICFPRKIGNNSRYFLIKRTH